MAGKREMKGRQKNKDSPYLRYLRAQKVFGIRDKNDRIRAAISQNSTRNMHNALHFFGIKCKIINGKILFHVRCIARSGQTDHAELQRIAVHKLRYSAVGSGAYSLGTRHKTGSL